MNIKDFVARQISKFTNKNVKVNETTKRKIRGAGNMLKSIQTDIKKKNRKWKWWHTATWFKPENTATHYKDKETGQTRKYRNPGELSRAQKRLLIRLRSRLGPLRGKKNSRRDGKIIREQIRALTEEV